VPLPEIEPANKTNGPAEGQAAASEPVKDAKAPTATDIDLSAPKLGVWLSPKLVTILSVVVIVALVLAFIAGLIVDRLLLRATGGE
jgi:hypothetical protein